MTKAAAITTAAASVAGDGQLSSVNVKPWMALLTHLICGLGLGSAFYVAYSVYSVNLTENPEQTIRLLWVIETPVVILLYCLFRHSPNRSSYLKAVLRGLLGLPAGAIVNAFGAIVLGAPMIQNFRRTIHWSLLMSVFTCVPAASVLGSSWADWQRIFTHTNCYGRPSKPLDYMICIPAHGAVIGAWFGAWPMPLDWERPWQEWPICVTYGAVTGYLAGMVASFGFIIFHSHRVRAKGD